MTKHKPVGQIGGFPGQQTAFATTYMRSMAKLAAKHGLPDGAIYVDVKGAFHHLLREVALNGGEFPATLLTVLETEGFDVQQLQANTQTQWTPEEEGLRRALIDAHSYTWLHLKHDPEGVLCTHRGTRPGSPLADLMFNCYMAGLLKSIQEAMSQDPRLERIAEVTGADFRVIAWVDDITLPMQADTNQELLQMVRDYVHLIAEIMTTHGFHLNYDRGKTEALLTFRGRDAPAHRRTLFLEEKGQLNVSTEPHDGKPQTLFVTCEYQHLGTKAGQNGRLQGELNHRTGQATQAYHQIRKKILTNKKIQTSRRLQLLESLVLTRLFYNSGSWPQLTNAQYTRLQHMVTSWQRQVVGEGFWSHKRISDKELRARWHLIDLGTRLARNRLLMAYHLVAQSKELAWKAACLAGEEDETSWLYQMRQAMDWMATLHPTFVPQDHALWNHDQLTHWFEATATNGPTMIRRRTKKHTLQESTMAEVVALHEEAHELFEQNGFKPHVLDATREREPAEEHHCRQCNKAFKTHQGLTVHRWKKHAVYSEERTYMTSAVCPGCATYYWSAQRLQQHLKYAKEHGKPCFDIARLEQAPQRTPVPIEVPDYAKKIHRLPAVHQREKDARDSATRINEALERAKERWQEEWKDLNIQEDENPHLKAQLHRALHNVMQRWHQEKAAGDQLLMGWINALESAYQGRHQQAYAFEEWWNTVTPEDRQMAVNGSHPELQRALQISEPRVRSIGCVRERRSSTSSKPQGPKESCLPNHKEGNAKRMRPSWMEPHWQHIANRGTP